MKYGEAIIITSDEFPHLRFGIYKESLRGVEVNDWEDEYEVRICTCSSHADYRLFVLTIDALMDLLSAPAYAEGDDSPIYNAFKTFDAEWIEREIISGWKTICTFSKYEEAPVLFGLFFKFCVGPHVLNSFDINICKPDCAKFQKLEQYLVVIQWGFSNSKKTKTNLAIPSSDNKEKLTISYIAIENNKLDDFDYVQQESLFGIVDMDNDDSVIIRFEDLHKILDDDSNFARFDEYQIRQCGIVTVEEVRGMLQRAKKYVPANFFQSPTQPGRGYDEKQNTFVLMWNPDTSAITMEQYVENIRTFGEEKLYLSIHDWKEAKMGDRFYIICTGDDYMSVVMSGTLGSHPYISPLYKGKGKKTYVVNLSPNMMLNPQTAPRLTVEELEAVVPDFMWRGGYSGRCLSKAQAEAMEKLYCVFLKKLEEVEDGINIRVKHVMETISV